jgi:predicted hotdog family 3-hydroxylacyl-ACP dehydratase
MTTQTLDHAGIAARIPHGGRMCLLERMLCWSAQAIRCEALSHLDLANPLRIDGTLPSPCAIEYAAQAMALHGALNAAPGSAPTPGMLASLRGVRMLVSRLDDIEGALTVAAQQRAGDAGRALYDFTLLDARGTLLVAGRATVILRAVP